jgi:putative two-component system response regulator
VTLLIVDDDPVSLRLLERILAAAGFGRVLTASDSSAVAGLCAREHPDVVVLDVSMPGYNGFDLLERLAPALAGDPPLRAVMLTGHDHPSIVARARQLGATAVLTKTGSRADLLTALDAALG